LQIEGKTPAEFFALLHTLWNALPTWNPQALFLALLSLAIIILWQKSTQPGGGQSGGQSVGQNTQGVSAMLHRIRSTTPGSIIALLVATILAQLFHLDVETIGSRFGGIPQGLPSFTIPLPHAADGGWSLSVIWEAMKGLVAPAATLAVLGAIESLLCARVADNMIKDKHDSNQELLAQGFANMVVPFFGGMPATGTIARTVTNIKNGATSPVSGIIHALVLLVVVLVAAPLAQYIPLAALSAILMFVAYNMGEWHEFARLRSYRMTYRFILLAVFILTVVVDLTAAVEVGILAACFTLIYRVSYLSTEDQIDLSEWGEQADGVKARRLVGTLFFGAVKLIDQLQLDIPKRALVLDFSGVIYVDSSGAESLNELLEMYQEKAVPIYIYGLREQPLEMLTRTGWLKDLGQAYVCANLDEARQKIAAQGA
jgi:SulP family sulfate permease